MRLVILTQYYPPEVGAPQARLSDLASRLSRRGHDVVVVTAMPNYPAGRVHERWRGRWTATEDQDGVRVLRSWIRPTDSASRPAQMVEYFSFVVSCAVTSVFRVSSADIVLWESPPLFLAPTAWLLARRTGARLVMNVSDLWPASAVDLGVVASPRMIRALESFERWSYRVADLVTCQTEGIEHGVLRRDPSCATALFPNGVDTRYFTPMPRDDAVRRRFGIPTDALVVGYAGNFGRSQALEQVVDAAAALEDGSGIWFHLVGDGPCRSEVVERARSLHNVVFSSSVPRSEMPALLASFDVSVVPLADAPVFEGARPSKMFELLAMGVPFVFCGRGEGAEIARRSGAAEIVDPEEPAALADAIRGLRKEGLEARVARGNVGRAFVAEHFDRERITDRIEERLAAVVKASHG